ncbi:helix-turn-helix domain-containing protein [Muricauda sp. TY007]|uniref:helix-turn-helix domain-containing protein n=1 Tax=Allomuricauda sp. TY007 TaxID=2683200 RepID=UPI0025DD3112|nr:MULTISPECIES: helix-turn-helix transcriptional regulator [unclassified Allomuricauda]
MLKEYTKEDMEVMGVVGKKIRQLRKESGMSQFQLSIEADLTKNQIGRIERAERNTSLVTLNRIAKALKVQLHELFLFGE